MNFLILEIEVVLNNWFGYWFNSLNDVVIMQDGVVYFIDGYYGYDNFNDILKFEFVNGVWRWEMNMGDVCMVFGVGGGLFMNFNGVVLNYEEDCLYVMNCGNVFDNLVGGRIIYEFNFVYYSVDKSGCKMRLVIGGDVFIYFDFGFLDGIKFDRDGCMYGGVMGGVYVFDEFGC